MGYKSLFSALAKASRPRSSASRTKLQTYVVINGQQAGPFTQTELQQLVKKGLLLPETYVWEAGFAGWVYAHTVPHINKLLILNAPSERKKKTPVAVEPAQAEHPLRHELIAAMAQLGYKGAATTQAVDELLAAQPDISSSAAIKQLLQSCQNHL